MTEKIKFKVYEGSETEEAEATVVNNVVTKIKIIVKCPRGYLYSLLNHAGEAFQELYPQFKHHA